MYRRGYDKVLMFRWLMYRQVMGCSYRDLESMTGIDHSTFIKFRKRFYPDKYIIAYPYNFVKMPMGVKCRL